MAPWELDGTQVSITEGPIPNLLPEAIDSGYCVKITQQEALLYLRSVGGVLVRAGHELLYERSPGASDKFARLFVLGPGLAMVLHQRGHLVLHSSSVALSVRGKRTGAVGFMGESGEGKSTMAAVLYERGHQVVTDDVTAIPPQFFNHKRPFPDLPVVPFIYPGFPMLKLWPKSAAALYSHEDALPLLDATLKDFPRRERSATNGFSLDPLPLRSLYILETSDEICIDRLSPQQALWALIKNSYWIADLPDDQRKLHFSQCSQLISSLPIYRLQRPRNLDLIERVAQAVEEHQYQAMQERGKQA